MAYGYMRGGREQLFLLPPSMLDWLEEGHLGLRTLTLYGCDRIEDDPVFGGGGPRVSGKEERDSVGMGSS